MSGHVRTTFDECIVVEVMRSPDRAGAMKAIVALTTEILDLPENRHLLTKSFAQIAAGLDTRFFPGAAWAYRMLSLRPGDRDRINADMDVAMVLIGRGPQDVAVEIGNRVRVWCEIARGERAAYGSDLFAAVERVVNPDIPESENSMTRNLELMWLANFIRSEDRQSAWIELRLETLEATEDEALESLIAGAEVNRGCATALARAVEAEHPTLALAWQAYAAVPSDIMMYVAIDLIRILDSSGLPHVTVDHSLARLYVWRKIAAGKIGGGDADLDIFRIAQLHWRNQLQRVETESNRVGHSVRVPLQLLGLARWDQAADFLKGKTAALLDPLDGPTLLAIFAGGDREEGVQRIRGLVAVLFDVGTTEAGELALGWMMMLATPERPSSVQHVVPQLAFMLDRALMSDEVKEASKKRLSVWWDAADGKHVSQSISIFQIAYRAVSGGGFDAARKAAVKELAQMDEVDVDPMTLGPTLVVMPKDKSTKLDGGHSVHGAFKLLVDRKLPLVVAHDVQAIRRQLHAEYPHATVAVDLLLRDLREDRPVTLKPMMLVGGPGAGKSRLVRRLGELLSLYVFRYDGAASLDSMFGGISKAWSSTQPSAPARAIEQAQQANPIVMIDEIEKAASDSSRNGSLANALMPFLEVETAKRFRDPSLDAELDLSRVTYVATANDDTHLPAPLKDRFRIIRVPDPTLAHLPALAANVMREMAASDEARMFDDPLADDELEIIGRAWKRSGMSMRKLQKIVSATLEARDQFSMRH